MKQTFEINKLSDIPSQYQNTPIGLFLEYHNLGRPFDTYSQAKLLVGMCMDSRKHLRIPDNFAFIIRAGGANLRYSEFKVSYAIGVGGVTHIVLLGHNQCGMSQLNERKDLFLEGMVKRAGWTEKEAEEHFEVFSKIHEIGNPADFILSEAKRLRTRYPKIVVAPMLYQVEDNRIYMLQED
jgi:carbonic anhydrase